LVERGLEETATESPCRVVATLTAQRRDFHAHPVHRAPHLAKQLEVLGTEVALPYKYCATEISRRIVTSAITAPPGIECVNVVLFGLTL
jgi:hypothetical protein